MIVNYDKNNGWNSAFGNIGSFFNGELNKNDALFVKRINAFKNLPKELGSIKTQPIDKLVESIGAVNTELVNSAKAVQSGKQSWDDFDATVTKVTKSSSKFSSFVSNAGSAIKSFGKSLGANLLNMGTGMLAGLAVSGIISGIEYLITYQDRLIEKGEEAKEKINESYTSFNDTKSSLDSLGSSFADNADQIASTGDAIDSIAKKYIELKDGVDKFNNTNKSLSDEDYQSYLDISEQLASQFPTLVSGYDAQGNAILNLGANAETAAQQITDLYNASMLSANVEIGNNLQDTYKGTMAQIQDYESQINSWQEQLNELQKYNLDASDLLNSTGTIELNTNEIPKDLRKKLDRILVDNGINRIMADNGMLQIDMSNISDDAATELEAVFSQMSDSVANESNELKKNIEGAQLMIDDQMGALAESIGQYLQTSDSFTGLDNTLQNAFISNIQDLDLSAISTEYGGDVSRFIYTEILKPLTDMRPEAQQVLADLIQFDPSNMNIDEYSDLVSKALYNAFPNDADMQNQMRKTFGFDKAIEEAEHQADALKNTLGQDFSDAIDLMSLDELEKGYDIVINGDEAISTVDELKSKIEQAQALAATSVDLDVHTNMDAIATALESVNAGADYESAVSYLQQAKDLFDKGLVGTDDFKSIAAYLSPTGSDDPVNFLENYGKAVRYLTEDASGVQNFLNDLESHDFANLETLSDGTQKWTYDIKDLEDAASDMGIGFEFMMDMFGRLEDYGFHNNFVGSVEDGTQRIADLATELAQEEAKLAQLQAEGADTTAIEQQQEKVNALKNDINETNAAMENLIAKSASDYNQEIDAAKQTISSLQAEYQKLMDNPELYGENTQLVADKLEEQIRSIAGEYGIELDADLNIKQPDTVPTIQVNPIFNKADLDSQLANLASGQKIEFGAELDGTFSDVTALMNENGTVTFSANIDGVEQQVALVKEENGVITFTADTTAVDEETQKTDGGERITSYEPDTSQVDAVNAVTDGGERAVEYFANTVNLPNYFPAITRTVNYVASGVGAAASALQSAMGKASGTMLFPAHASGTAYNILNLKPAYANGSVSLPKDEKALVNELGTESIIRSGQWSLLPGGMHIESLKKGDIILNASQTKALLQYGRASGHARAYASGTLLSAYAGGYGGGVFWGNAGSGSSGSGSSYGGNSGSSRSSSNNSSSASDAAKEFEETIDWIEMAIDRLERAIDTLDLKASSTYRSWSERNKNLTSEISKVTQEINLQQQGYNRYLQQANSVGLSSDWASKVQNGDVDISTVTDEDLADKISEYQNWYEKALDCRDAIEELRETESELYEQAFEHISTMFDGIVGQLEHFRNMMEGYVDQTETAGYIVSQQYYSALIENEQDTLEKLNEERDQLIASLNDAVNSGAIAKESEAWYSMMEEINSVDEAIQDSTTSIIEFKNEMRQLEWDIFDKFQEAVSGITTESDFLVDLMSNDKLFDDRGQITDQGKATMGLHGVNYNTYMSQADEYRKAIDELNKEIEKDPYNQTLLERRKELLELQQESILAAEDEKQALKDLVSDGIEAELDSLQELINKYNDLLDSQHDMYQYQQQIAEKQQEIANLEKQLAAYQGDDSEEGAANRQDLQNQLNEARQDMEETLFDRAISEQQKLVQSLFDDYSEVLNMRLDNIDLLLMDIVGNVNSESSAIRDTIISEAEDVGYKLTDTMNTIWGDGGKLIGVITNYGNNFTSAITGVQTAINDLKDIMKKAIEDANRRAQSNISNTNGSSSGSSSGGSSSGSNTNTSSSSQGNGTPNIGDAVTFVSGSYYYSSDGLTPTGNQLLGQTVYITRVNNASWATKPYHIARDAAGTRPLGWVSLDQIRGYKTGSKYISEDQLAWTNEGGNPETIIAKDGSILTPLPRGSSVLNTAAHNNLWDMATDPSDFIKRNLDIDTSALLAQNNKPSQINNTISINIPIDRVQDYNDFIRQLQNDPKAEKLIQSIAFDQVTGRGRMGKYKVNLNN